LTTSHRKRFLANEVKSKNAKACPIKPHAIWVFSSAKFMQFYGLFKVLTGFKQPFSLASYVFCMLFCVRRTLAIILDNGRDQMNNRLRAQENIPVNEARYIEDLTERLKAKIIRDNAKGIMRRDAHPKMHGVVKAEFIIEANLPPELRIGLFKEANIYPAWIRFSNQDGSINPDKGRDIRGMAIKLMGVFGEKVLEEEKDEQTHDFILISTDRFVTKDVQEFDQLIASITGSLLAKLWFFLTHLRVGWNLLKSMVQFANPLQIRYFSTTPYLFGESAVKYSAIPQIKTKDTIPNSPDDDYLRLAMVRQLQQEEALFDFALQFQTDAQAMPIEDPGVVWSETLSPFIKVATIRIFQQEFDSAKQREFGENISYNPWHALPEHRPLGGINRARKIVYRTISLFRHEYNKTPRREPDTWDIDENSQD
jgi:hypothetical protein